MRELKSVSVTTVGMPLRILGRSRTDWSDPACQGICVLSAGATLCQPAATRSREALLQDLGSSSSLVEVSRNPGFQHFLDFALSLQSKIIASPIPAAGVLFLVGIISRFVVRHWQSKKLKSFKLFLSVVSTNASRWSLVLATASALMATGIGRSLKFVSASLQPSSTTIWSGEALIALLWTVVAFTAIDQLWIESMMLSRGHGNDDDKSNDKSDNGSDKEKAQPAKKEPATAGPAPTTAGPAPTTAGQGSVGSSGGLAV